MMLDVLTLKLDIVAFAIVAMLASAVVALVIRNKQRRSALPRRMLGVVLFLTAATVLNAYSAGESERDRLTTMVSGIAPTYALETDRLGHHQLTLQSSPDDPIYQQLVQRQKEWLKANPGVADIYTMMRTPDGKFAFIVDSETDYNHSGSIDEEREERTSIGETYDDLQTYPNLNAAADGKDVFSAEVNTDRWGSWVSATVPIRDDAGKVYAILGVDFPAEKWINSILAVRRSHLLIGLVITAIALVATFMISQLQGEVFRRENAELASKASENRLRLIVDNEPESVIVLDRDGKIMEINPSGVALLGRAGATPVGMSFRMFVSDDQRAAFDQHMDSVVAGAPGIMEIRVAGDGDKNASIWLDTHCVPLRDSRGNVESSLLVARDVTARKIAEVEKENLQRQLVDASRQAGMAEIATGVLHNVGNVLNSVNVSASLITQKLRDSRLGSFAKLTELIESQKANLGDFVSNDPRGKCLPDFLTQLYSRFRDDHEQVTKELEQLTRGIEHIKEVVRMQQTCATTGSTMLTLVEPTSIMEDAIKVNLVSMERHCVHLERAYEAGLPPLNLDKHKILQILINLISNAKRATCDPSVADRHIQLTVRQIEDGKSLEFRVKDNGVGIEPQNMSKLFRHGFTTRDDGHGFGLHSSSNAANEMKGALRVESGGPGKGATFILTVPANISQIGLAA